MKSLILLILLAAPSHALSLGQMRNHVRSLIRDRYMDFDERGVERFTDWVIDDFLNEAQRDMQNNAWLYQGAFTMDFTSGTIEYPLPSDYITTIRVTVASMSITQVSEAGLDGGNGSQDATSMTGMNWTVSLSTPMAYFIDSFVSGSPSRIGFFPNPKYTTSGGTVFVQYVRQIQNLVNDTDVPFGGNSEILPYHDALIDFAASRCLYLSGKNDLAGTLMAMYAARTSAARANLNRMPNFTPGASGNRGPRQ